MAHLKTISYIYVIFINSILCKCHMSLKIALLRRFSRVVLAGCQNIVDRCLMAYIIAILYIYIFLINSTIYNFLQYLFASMVQYSSFFIFTLSGKIWSTLPPPPPYFLQNITPTPCLFIKKENFSNLKKIDIFKSLFSFFF